MTIERVVADLAERVDRRYYGKYRGIVVDNQDPNRMGRVTARVPSVFGPDAVTGWATACVPTGGLPGEGLFFIPPRDAGVWIEFEEGDLEFPIWVGTYWSKPAAGSEAPKPADKTGKPAGEVQDPPTCRVLRTGKGHTVQFEEADSNEAITIVDGANHHVIRLDKTGITITDGVNAHQVVLDKDGIAIGDGKNKHKVVLDQTGVKIAEKDGTAIEVTNGGISIGTGATEKLVLGSALKTAVDTFINSLNTHTHTGNLGAPTSPPAVPLSLEVPLSDKHKVK
ncbi:phage baseplate assembly protein V [Paractinoplanes durhamensis]|uniref:Baseplate assembly protein n=1 Tax=Paractinoplanes durhamensis TaxID=113563 RepID=A0ABQ3Z739_9ACTN|nr:phage baseplate assembly protein V [Actinoplanes durhamensis]GIE05667.1 baseplate assembly protein [Actinoplanes durhamensis]